MRFSLTTTLTLAKDQKLIESEWIGFKIAIGLDDSASQIQIDEMRNAFYAGARFMDTTIVQLGEADIKPSEFDAAINGIEAEFATFLSDFAAKNLPTAGGVH